MAKMGRPPKYNESYPDRLIEIAKNDEDCISKEYLAVQLDIHKDTLYDWIKKYPDFSAALKKAMQYIEIRYQKLGYAMATGANQKGNPTSYIWLTKNVLNYSDKVENKNVTQITSIDFQDDEDEDDE